MKNENTVHPEGKQQVLAGIVTWNPDLPLLRKNVEALKGQAGSILIVDNHSDNRKEVLELARNLNLKYIQNAENKGLAFALNQILGEAEKGGFEWFITMDQDSVVSDNLMEAFRPAMQEEKTGIVCPFLLNNQKITREEAESLNLPDYEAVKEPLGCITSASLNRTAAARKAGGYRESLFVDGIDADFNIRLMEAGYSITRANRAFLEQQMGDGRQIRLMKKLADSTGKNVFRRLSVSPVYSDFRIYHIARNTAFLHRLYGEKAGRQMQPAWMNAQFAYYLLTFPKERSRRKMIEAWRKGRKDAGKMLEDEPC